MFLENYKCNTTCKVGGALCEVRGIMLLTLVIKNEVSGWLDGRV